MSEVVSVKASFSYLESESLDVPVSWKVEYALRVICREDVNTHSSVIYAWIWWQ